MADLTLAEKETHLNMSAADRNVWEISTDDEVMQRRFESIGAKLIYTRGGTKFYTLPANQVSLRNKRELSDKQRAALAERGKALAALSRAQAVQP